MADIPDGIVLTRDRDLAGRAKEIWIRRGLFTLLPIIAVLALANTFGQHPIASTKATSAATLKVSSPPRLRSGLIYQARFHITAHRDLQKATLVLGPGWLESMSINSIEPSPASETSANGELSLELGHVSAGHSYLLFIYFQTNPTNVGHRETPVRLLDGDEHLLEVDRSVTIFP
jgi:hypothetical protein